MPTTPAPPPSQFRTGAAIALVAAVETIGDFPPRYDTPEVREVMAFLLLSARKFDPRVVPATGKAPNGG